jgi:hypothetical protein
MSEGDGSELVGKREDHMGIGHGKHIGLTCLEPVRLGAALTFGAMPVTARVVRDLAVPAVGAGVDVTAERRGATPNDAVDDPALLGPGRRDRNAGALQSTKDLGDLVRRSLGHLPGHRGPRASRGLRADRMRSEATCM